MEELIPHFEQYGIALNLEAHPYDFSERNDDAVQIIRGLNRPWVNYVFCAPHAFHLSDGAGDVRRMMEYAGGKLKHLHIADCFNHRANVGNRYIINPPGVDARIHQHNEIGNGDLDWDEFFATLRERAFDGIATVCVFGWEEDADAIHRRMLEKLTSELRRALDDRRGAASSTRRPSWASARSGRRTSRRCTGSTSARPRCTGSTRRSGATRTWPMPSRIGSFGLRDGGGAVVALVDGFHLLDFDTGALTFARRARARAGHPVQRRQGVARRPVLRRHDGRGAARPPDRRAVPARSGRARCTAVVDGLIVSNGLAWSADGRTMFHSDSKAQVVWTYDYDPGSGAVADRRELARPTEEQGRPDGAAADEKGYYWSAGISAGVLNRWAPDGALDRSIPLPCSNPTAPCFGGPDLRTIFVTSLRHDLPAGGARRQAAVRRDLRRPGRRPRRAGQPVPRADHGT